MTTVDRPSGSPAGAGSGGGGGPAARRPGGRGLRDRGLHGQAVRILGERIAGGHYPPGETLDPVVLGQEFGVSRTVVREALRALAAKGMVDARPNRGTFVRPREDWSLLDPDLLAWQFAARSDERFLRELSEVRAIVEPAAARLAARRRDENDVRVLLEALEAMASGGRDLDAQVAADLVFHRAVLCAAGNELLEQMETVIEIGLRARDQLVHARGDWRDATGEHRAVAEAIVAREEDRAEAAMRRLIIRSVEDLRELGVVSSDADGDPGEASHTGPTGLETTRPETTRPGSPGAVPPMPEGLKSPDGPGAEVSP